MAARLLEKLGKEALQPQLVNGVWRKAAISAKNAARLRKETLLAGGYVIYGVIRCPPSSPSLLKLDENSLAPYTSSMRLHREWPFDEPKKEVKQRKPKGHKHDREKPLR